MTTEKPNMEFSHLTGRATQSGVTVTVKVYRFAGTQDPWTLEVIDRARWSTVWTELGDEPQRELASSDALADDRSKDLIRNLEATGCRFLG